MIRAIALGLTFLLLAFPAHASSFVSDKVTKKIYRISGNTLPQLKHAMRQNGPRGYWAYTKTNWKWDGNCNVTFWATITMPELANRSTLSKADLARWDAMVTALWAHEMEHVKIGRQWAGEIKTASCARSAVQRIDQKWGGADAALDRRTDHGRLEGVVLSP